MIQFCFPSIAGAVYFGMFWGFILGAYVVFGIYTTRDIVKENIAPVRGVFREGKTKGCTKEPPTGPRPETGGPPPQRRLS